MPQILCDILLHLDKCRLILWTPPTYICVKLAAKQKNIPTDYLCLLSVRSTFGKCYKLELLFLTVSIIVLSFWNSLASTGWGNHPLLYKPDYLGENPGGEWSITTAITTGKLHSYGSLHLSTWLYMG